MQASVLLNLPKVREAVKSGNPQLITEQLVDLQNIFKTWPDQWFPAVRTTVNELTSLIETVNDMKPGAPEFAKVVCDQLVWLAQTFWPEIDSEMSQLAQEIVRV